MLIADSLSSRITRILLGGSAAVLLVVAIALAWPAPGGGVRFFQLPLPQEAAAISRKLEAGWRKSGSAAMDLLLQRGADALEEGDYALAIDHLTALTDHAPGFAEGWHLRAQAYYRRSLYGPALADLERTLALNPDQYNAIFGFATMVQEFGDSARAAALYRMVLDLNPHHENAQKALDALRREGIGRRL